MNVKKMVPICLIEDSDSYNDYYQIYNEKINTIYYIGYKEHLNYFNTPASDYQISKTCKISEDEYEKIVLKNNGYHDVTFDSKNNIRFNFVFNSKVDCQNAIDDLFSYILIKELIGGK